MPLPGKPFGFEVLLASLMVLLFVPGLIPTSYGGLVTSLLLLGTLLASVYVTANSPREVAAGGLMIVAIIATSWSLGFLPDTIRVAINCLIYIGFLVFVCRQIMRFMLRSQEMTLQLIYASICVYLIMGLLWTFLYVFILLFSPDAIKLASVIEWDQSEARDVFAEMFYFSFVTMTTLGYGDVLPVSRLARSLATLQAVIGQLYIAIVVASLVGIQINQRTSNRH